MGAGVTLASTWVIAVSASSGGAGKQIIIRGAIFGTDSALVAPGLAGAVVRTGGTGRITGLESDGLVFPGTDLEIRNAGGIESLDASGLTLETVGEGRATNGGSVQGGVTGIRGTNSDGALVLFNSGEITGGEFAFRSTSSVAADRPVFDTALDAGANLDRVADVRTDLDGIRLDDAVFAALAEGNLAGGAFRANASGLAGDASDRIIFETDTGILRYETDGSAAGAAVTFARLSAGLALGADDFVVI